VRQKYCPECGDRVADNANFCGMCGAALAGASPPGAIGAGAQRAAKSESGTRTQESAPSSNVPPVRQVTATPAPSQTDVAAPPPPNYLARNIAVGICLLLIIGLAGAFHIVSTGSSLTDVTLIPKAHFTFASTFVSTDDVIKRYNGRSFGDAFARDELFDNLVRQLEQRGYITWKRTWKEIEDETRRNLPDQ